MPTQIGQQLIIGLLLWSLIWLGAATTRLYTSSNQFWRAFWFMSGLWGLIDGGIAWFALLQGPQSPGDLTSVLRINSGLDVAYILTSLFLLTRKTPTLRGFGLAVLVQGVFLFLLDVYFWWRCSHALG